MPKKPDIKFKIPKTPCFYYIAASVGITCYFSKIPVGKAQILGDNTLPTSTEVSSGTKKGFDFLITGGTKVGNNLFHSFKQFSVPNHRHKMPLKERVYVCPNCGNKQDRDLNASKNIERWFEGIFIPTRSSQTVSSTGIACGVDKPLRSHSKTTMRQEVNTKTNEV